MNGLSLTEDGKAPNLPLVDCRFKRQRSTSVLLRSRLDCLLYMCFQSYIVLENDVQPFLALELSCMI